MLLSREFQSKQSSGKSTVMQAAKIEFPTVAARCEKPNAPATGPRSGPPRFAAGLDKTRFGR